MFACEAAWRRLGAACKLHGGGWVQHARLHGAPMRLLSPPHPLPAPRAAATAPAARPAHLCQGVEGLGVPPEEVDAEDGLRVRQPVALQLAVQARAGGPEIRNPGRHADAGPRHHHDPLSLARSDQIRHTREVEAGEERRAGGRRGGGGAAGGCLGGAADARDVESVQLVAQTACCVVLLSCC